MKKCPKCEQIKSLGEFGVCQKRSDGKQVYCKLCYREIHRLYYKRSDDRKKQIRESVSKSRSRNTAFAFDFLMKHPCVDCGESNPLYLDFDHVCGEKILCVSQMVNGCYSLDNLQQEISKCEIRCVKCHRHKTAIECGWYKSLPLSYKEIMFSV